MKKTVFSIQFLANNKKVIPIYFKNGDEWHTNVKLPDLVLETKADGPTYAIEDIILIGLTGSKQLITLQYCGEIEKTIQNANQLLNKLTQEPTSQWKEYNLHMLFGNVPKPRCTFGESHQLKSSYPTCLRLQDFFSFHYAGKDKIDHIVCRVKLTSEDDETIVEAHIQLTSYHCVGDYIFPIAGSATVTGTPWNRVLGHRVANSQEFAFDVVDYRSNEKGEFVLSSPPNSSKVEDYFLFEREVLAIGNGIVVAAGNRWPNEWVMNPLNYSEERIIELTQKLLSEGLDFNHAILGNYIIIDHQNDEFSLYAHMSEGTLTVEVGDSVKQGQVIGRVGNTSNSDFPHLHFHLMDSMDFQTANGLPVMFKNLLPGQAPIYDFNETNSLIYSDYLFLRT